MGKDSARERTESIRCVIVPKTVAAVKSILIHPFPDSGRTEQILVRNWLGKKMEYFIKRIKTMFLRRI